jgi:hypothetical protein
MKTRTMCATLLAIGSVIAGGSAAGAASAKPCDGRDELVSASGLESYDDNGNGDVCAHKEKSVAPKKHGGSWGTTYYDDNA